METTVNSRECIQELVTKYCRGVDGRDEALFRSIWGENPIYDVGGNFDTYAGIDQVVEGIRAIWGAFTETHHWTTNVSIDFTTDDAATSTSNVLAHMIDTDGRFIVCAADYADRFERSEEGWRFQQRSITIHYLREVPATPYG